MSDIPEGLKFAYGLCGESYSKLTLMPNFDCQLAFCESNYGITLVNWHDGKGYQAIFLHEEVLGMLSGVLNKMLMSKS